MNGFEIAFERNYNLTDDSRQSTQFSYAVVDVLSTAIQTPLDHLEQLLMSVPTPGPSLMSAASQHQQPRFFTLNSMMAV
ncbi:hypothetical protein PTRG_06689 [Pyrenophora tritici-repentis Pt-1C-BFP]|uniref:Uncharacterized protein n=1 Tax=Pyrenophora tritici-repentis (strain Pt-1C-BFP) TaxID=426418 RepID=B2W9N1_PYRTR|nr:uncharacterized protein PTRG_06689 [Pyrenophora tritici-repentis Pt-1C-BFP]EDU49609.1 hypothetical protein PTRG_06689 [Pyrenophora tritici-repentis Pt-1C-BFP]